MHTRQCLPCIVYIYLVRVGRGWQSGSAIVFRNIRHFAHLLMKIFIHGLFTTIVSPFV